jgi:hypothetical protein
MLTLGSGTIDIAYWKPGAVAGQAAGNRTTAYFAGTVGYGNTGELVTIGEIGGDVEFDINFQEREFYGQQNFPVAKAYFGGKCEVRARGVEVKWDNLKNLFHNDLGLLGGITATTTGTTVYGYAVTGHEDAPGNYLFRSSTGGGSVDSAVKGAGMLPGSGTDFVGYSRFAGQGGQASPMGLPRPIYVRFTHRRSDDPSQTVRIHLPKAYSMALTIPFTREDISTMDLDFSGTVDRSCKLETADTSATPSIVFVQA